MTPYYGAFTIGSVVLEYTMTNDTAILDTPIGAAVAEKRIRIVIADDHPIVRDGIRRLLSLESDIDVVGEAGDGRAVLDVVHETNPDVLLLDLRMPNLDGLGALETLQQTHKRTRVIILTASEELINSICSFVIKTVFRGSQKCGSPTNLIILSFP